MFIEKITGLLKDKKDKVCLTVCRNEETGQIVVSMVPQFADNTRAFVPLSMIGKPDEFDSPDLDFSPLEVAAAKSIKEAIAESAKATAAAPPAITAAAPISDMPQVKRKYTRRATEPTVAPAPLPAGVPPPPEDDTEEIAARLKAEEEARAEADAKAKADRIATQKAALKAQMDALERGELPQAS